MAGDDSIPNILTQDFACTLLRTIFPDRSSRLAGVVRLCNYMCGGLHMATNLSIDPDLIQRALELSGERTKKAAVTKALQEFIARRRQKRLLDLVGKLDWDSSYDYKAERTRA
jgi:Arc/MetJ family transcription regulator